MIGKRNCDGDTLYLKLLKDKVRKWEENNWHLSKTPQQIMDMYAEIDRLENSRGGE